MEFAVLTLGANLLKPGIAWVLGCYISKFPFFEVTMSQIYNGC
jgi:hypothetical protein